MDLKNGMVMGVLGQMGEGDNSVRLVLQRSVSRVGWKCKHYPATGKGGSEIGRQRGFEQLRLETGDGEPRGMQERAPRGESRA